MEIRTIGNSSVGIRPVVDSGLSAQAAQNPPSDQGAVQTTKAVPQVSAMESMGGMRKSADSAEAAKVNPDMPGRQAVSQTRPDEQRVTKGGDTKVASETTAGEKQRAEEQRDIREVRQPLDEVAIQAEKERAEQAMKSVSESLGSRATQLSFSVDEELGRVIVKIVDPETDEVIKQIPSEDAVALAKSLGKMTGVFLKAQA